MCQREQYLHMCVNENYICVSKRTVLACVYTDMYVHRCIHTPDLIQLFFLNFKGQTVGIILLQMHSKSKYQGHASSKMAYISLHGFVRLQYSNNSYYQTVVSRLKV